MSVDGKKVLLGITGGIAAYKAVDLASRLGKAGLDVHVAMTASAQKFVTPLTFRTVTRNRVVTTMWDPVAPAQKVEHIELPQAIDLMVICPATANIMAKRACGIADDFLSTALLSTTAPILFCPSMNDAMWRAAPTQRNLETLRSDGCHILEPDSGWLACGYEGKGRLPAPEAIAEHVLALLGERSGEER